MCTTKQKIYKTRVHQTPIKCSLRSKSNALVAGASFALTIAAYCSLGSAKAALYSIVPDSVLANLGAEPYGEFRKTLAWTNHTSIRSTLLKRRDNMRMVALGEINSEFYIWLLKLTATSSLALLGMLSFCMANSQKAKV